MHIKLVWYYLPTSSPGFDKRFTQPSAYVINKNIT